MPRQQRLESDVGDLGAVQSEENLIVNVPAYFLPKPFACSSSHSMDAVLDLHSKPCSIPNEVDYLLFQIGDTHHDIRNPVCLEPLNNPLKERFPAYFDETLVQV